MVEVNGKSIDMIVFEGHCDINEIDSKKKLETYDFFNDSGVQWFRPLRKKVSLEWRNLLKSKFSDWVLVGEDSPSLIGNRAKQFLEDAPESTEVMLLTYQGSYATRSGSESVIARFYGHVIKEDYYI